MVVQACFIPAGECSTHIIRELEEAQKEIPVAVFAFTSSDIARALVRAKRRGVKVQVVLDREFDSNDYSQGSFLKKKGLKVRRVSGLSKGEDRHASMHPKFAVIDGRVVLTSSYNWTASAENYNAENLLLFRDAGPLAEEYRSQFYRLWGKGR
jgi:phosphatidylserine/phosphatidylglycerophosphate/cardiolipin synthase-like enzyme